MDSVEKESNRTQYFRTIDGKKLLHRENGPAVVWESGDLEYHVNGIYHRIGGPAVEYTNLHIWFENGLRHRVDGPAFVGVNAKKYYYKGKHIDVKTDEDFDNFIRFKAFW